ncbi:MAG: hypothetical protein K6U78_05500 [Anaerolineae bacterium]|nr:hypothetical protein [Anaerolineae bacterium]
MGTIICYDLDFTDTARKITQNGAQLILVPSHDWPEIATKHYTHLVFRAVENRVAMVKADSSGNDSAVIDPYGRIMAAAITPGGDQIGQVVVGDVPLGAGDALAVRLGDWTGWLALAGMIVFVFYDRLTANRTKAKAHCSSTDPALENSLKADCQISLNLAILPGRTCNPRGSQELRQKINSMRDGDASSGATRRSRSWVWQVNRYPPSLPVQR